MLLDASGLLCYLDKDDLLHEKAVELFDTADSILVCDYVLADIYSALPGSRFES